MTRPVAPGAARRAYVRPMHAWWRRDPFFVRYMVRELTALAVLAYSLVLAAGLVCLARGEAAWLAWLAALRSPWSLALHVVLLVGFIVHARSWFEVMPRTMPPLHWRGRRLAATTITRLGWAATLASSLLVFVLAWVVSR